MSKSADLWWETESPYESTDPEECGKAGYDAGVMAERAVHVQTYDLLRSIQLAIKNERHRPWYLFRDWYLFREPIDVILREQPPQPEGGGK